MKIFALVVMLTMPDGSQYETAVPMLSLESCGAALTEIADALSADWPDNAVLCRDTPIMFSSPRPMVRPASLTEGN